MRAPKMGPRWERLGVQQSGAAVLTPSQFMFSQLLSTVDVPHSPSASHIMPTATALQLAMMSRALLAGHSVCTILFKQNPQVSYPASQRAHGKPARDEESASNSSAATWHMLTVGTASAKQGCATSSVAGEQFQRTTAWSK